MEDALKKIMIVLISLAIFSVPAIAKEKKQEPTEDQLIAIVVQSTRMVQLTEYEYKKAFENWKKAKAALAEYYKNSEQVKE